MRALRKRIDCRYYPTWRDHWDDWLFRERVLAHLRPHMRLLDIGAGAGILPQTNFRNLAAEVVGIDLDPRIRGNPNLDHAVIADCNAIPFADETFDIVVADNVLEHLREPAKTFREVHRVLKPGGVFVAKTPNKWHYMPIIARLTPHSFHEWFNQLRGRSSVDTFRTLYRANSRRDIRRLAREAGFEVLALELTEGRPEYLRLTTPTYLLGMIYERGVNSTEWLAGLRILLTVELRKRPA